jgi:hypothetical protein
MVAWVDEGNVASAVLPPDIPFAVIGRADGETRPSGSVPTMSDAAAGVRFTEAGTSLGDMAYTGDTAAGLLNPARAAGPRVSAAGTFWAGSRIAVGASTLIPDACGVDLWFISVSVTIRADMAYFETMTGFLPSQTASHIA